MLKMGTEYPTAMNSTKIFDSFTSLLLLKAILIIVTTKKITCSTCTVKLRRKTDVQVFVSTTLMGAADFASQRNFVVAHINEYLIALRSGPNALLFMLGRRTRN